MPRSSSRTSACTIERPVPAAHGADTRAVVGDREHDLAVPPRELDANAVAAVLERVLQQLGEDQGERRRASAGKRDRLELRRHLLAAADALDEHRAQPVDQVGELDVLVAPLGQQLVHRRDRENAIDRMLERLARIDRVRRTAPADEAATRRSGGCSSRDGGSLARAPLASRPARARARPRRASRSRRATRDRDR